MLTNADYYRSLLDSTTKKRQKIQLENPIDHKKPKLLDSSLPNMTDTQQTQDIVQINESSNPSQENENLIGKSLSDSQSNQGIDKTENELVDEIRTDNHLNTIRESTSFPSNYPEEVKTIDQTQKDNKVSSGVEPAVVTVNLETQKSESLDKNEDHKIVSGPQTVDVAVNEFRLKQIELVRQRNKDTICNIISELESFNSFCEKRVLKIETMLVDLAKVTLVNSNAVQQINVNKLLSEKKNLRIASTQVLQNIRILSDLKYDEFDNKISCPDLGEDTDRTHWANHLTKLIWQRQTFKQKIHHSKEAILAIANLSQDQDQKLLGLSNLNFDFKQLEKNLEKVNLQIFAHLKKLIG